MPKQVNHEDMRHKLLDAAGALFVARGYAAAGMRDLARAAGVSTGSLYHYFPDKRALFEQLVERTVDGDLADLEAVLAAVPASTPLRLDAFLELVRSGEEELQLQSAVLVEYARLARAEAGISLDASRTAHARYVAALARLLDASRTAHARYVAALARLLDVSGARAELILHAVTGLLLQRFTDGGATPFAPLERQLRAFCATPEEP